MAEPVVTATPEPATALPTAAVAAPPPAVDPPAPAAAAPLVAAAPVVSQETKAPDPAIPAAEKPAEVTPGDVKPVEIPKPEPVKSLLGEQMQKPAEKPAEKPPVEAPKTEPVKVEPVKYEAFKLPEGATVNQENVDKYTAILGQHQVPQEAAQQLFDLYAADVARRDQLQRETWNRTREGWISEFRNDGEIGGNRQDTTLQRCAQVLDQYAQAVGAERAQNLKTVFAFTGAGDHPELIRFVNWAAGFTVERARPIAATVPKAPMPTTRAQRRYANPAFSTGAT